jgi:hypothetical protein
MPQPTYSTLEDIQQRKEAVHANIQKDNERIGLLWHDLTAPQKSDTKGELIANLISNSITAIDAFLLVRKLMKSYGYLFGKKKRR